MKRSSPEPCEKTFSAFQTAPADGEMEKSLLEILRSLAAFSRHPLAREAIRVAEANRIGRYPVLGFQEFEGEGLGGAVRLPGEAGHRAALVGKRAFLEKAGMSVPDILEVAARRWEKEGALVLFAGWDGYVRGLLKFT